MAWSVLLLTVALVVYLLTIIPARLALVLSLVVRRVRVVLVAQVVRPAPLLTRGIILFSAVPAAAAVHQAATLAARQSHFLARRVPVSLVALRVVVVVVVAAGAQYGVMVVSAALALASPAPLLLRRLTAPVAVVVALTPAAAPALTA